MALHKTISKILIDLDDGPINQFETFGNRLERNFNNNSAASALASLNPWILYVASNQKLRAAMRDLPPSAAQFAADLLLWVRWYINGLLDSLIICRASSPFTSLPMTFKLFRIELSCSRMSVYSATVFRHLFRWTSLFPQVIPYDRGQRLVFIK